MRFRFVIQMKWWSLHLASYSSGSQVDPCNRCPKVLQWGESEAWCWVCVSEILICWFGYLKLKWVFCAGCLHSAEGATCGAHISVGDFSSFSSKGAVWRVCNWLVFYLRWALIYGSFWIPVALLSLTLFSQIHYLCERFWTDVTRGSLLHFQRGAACGSVSLTSCMSVCVQVLSVIMQYENKAAEADKHAARSSLSAIVTGALCRAAHP